MVPAGCVILSDVRSPLGIRVPMRLALLVMCSALVPAACGQYFGMPVGAVEFDPPDQPMPRADLDRLLPFRPGDILRESDIRTAIERLFDTGCYLDIAVDAHLESGKVVLRLITEPAYFVGHVGVEGTSDPPSRAQLATATKLQVGAKVSASDLAQAVENIRERLSANGLYQAQVHYTTSRDPQTEQENIDFTIIPGKRAHFHGVNVTDGKDVPAGRVIRATGWQRGWWLFGWGLLGWKQVTEARVSSGLDRVRKDFQKGNRLLSNVTLVRLDYHSATNTVTPTLRVEIGPKILVRTVGARVSRGKLRQLIPIYQERSVDRSLLVEGRRNLLEYFRSQGYFDAKVDFDMKPPAHGQQEIDYLVDRDSRHKLVHVAITGNHYFDAETLRERMQVTPASWPRYRYGRYGQRMLDQDVQSIQELYRSNGFREAQVTSKVEDNYGGKQAHLGILIQIREGPQWFVSKLEFAGISPEDATYLRTILRSANGQPYSELNVAADRDTILAFYYNNGYADATFDWNESPADTPNQVSLRFLVNPGRREYVRRVLVGGLETTNRDLVTNRIRLKAGDPISRSQMAESQQKLYDLGIFSDVQAAVQNPSGIENSKYVVYEMHEARKYSLNAGFGAQAGRIGGGVTSFDAPAGTAGFSPEVSLGLSRMNFFGLGHTVSLQGLLSSFDKRSVLTYLAPQFRGNENLALTFSGLYEDSVDIRTFAAKRREGSIQLNQRISRASTLQYRYTFRWVTLSDLKITPELVPILAQPVRVGSISASWIQDRRDNPTDAHKGIYNTVDFALAEGPFGSQTGFGRLMVQNSTYHPIGKNLVLARSTQFGDMQRLSGLPEIPLAERFFGGGSYTNRAFPDNQAGPRDFHTGFPLGGQALFFNTIELRFPLIGDTIGGVLFHDAGNVYDDIRHMSFRFRQRNLQDFNYMVHAFGFGIRYRTPIGPVRLDLALSPNTPRFFGFRGTEEQLILGQGQLVNQRISIFQFHFSLGQTF